MFNFKNLAILTLFVLASGELFGQAAVPARSGSAGSSNFSTKFLPLDEVREGMRGTALTVFGGSRPEEFEVEIIGIIPGAVGPKQDLIVGRIGGGKADRTAVFAGMSGSPVYVDGKLLGAISYSFPFSKEPICGITPIEQMIAIFEENPRPRTLSAEPLMFSFEEMAFANPFSSPAWSLSGTGGIVAAAAPGSMLSAVAGQSFRPIGTPVTFTGISQQVLDMFAPQLLKAGLIPVGAAGGASRIGPMKRADETTLRGGDSVAMQLTRGDFSMAASGTVTLRDGDRIYAFGHPFINLGSTELPMSESHVVTVVPNVNNSFKLAVPDAMVGSMTQDRATGVFGKLGQAPRMIPVTINLETSRGKNDQIQFEVARDNFLTPLLLNIAVVNAIVSQERSLGDTTVEVNGKINIAGHPPVNIERRLAGGQASAMAAGSISAPVSALLRSRFDELEIGSIVLDIRSTDDVRTATLDRLAIDRTQVRPGDTVELRAFVRTASGRVFAQRIEMKIPVDAPAGSYSIVVGDGFAVQQNSSIQQFAPRNLPELIGMINKLKQPDRLYVQMFRTSTGAIIGASEMPNLPPSVLATLNNDRTTGGVKPAVQTVVLENAVAPAEFIISGQQTLTIEVVK
jgi:hypothetical protein